MTVRRTIAFARIFVLAFSLATGLLLIAATILWGQLGDFDVVAPAVTVMLILPAVGFFRAAPCLQETQPCQLVPILLGFKIRTLMIAVVLTALYLSISSALHRIALHGTRRPTGTGQTVAGPVRVRSSLPR
jgi:hypothetical protein